MATYASKHKYARKSIFLVMTQMKRFVHMKCCSMISMLYLQHLYLPFGYRKVSQNLQVLQICCLPQNLHCLLINLCKRRIAKATVCWKLISVLYSACIIILSFSAVGPTGAHTVINAVARDDTGMFSVGQSLRIRVGPLKGYICRVLAVRRSDVTVKLDSKHKIITGMMLKLGLSY